MNVCGKIVDSDECDAVAVGRRGEYDTLQPTLALIDVSKAGITGAVPGRNAKEGSTDPAVAGCNAEGVSVAVVPGRDPTVGSPCEVACMLVVDHW